jgi:hypothetical protein
METETTYESKKRRNSVSTKNLWSCGKQDRNYLRVTDANEGAGHKSKIGNLLTELRALPVCHYNVTRFVKRMGIRKRSNLLEEAG